MRTLAIMLLLSGALRAETYEVPGTNITLTSSVAGGEVTIGDCNEDATGQLQIPPSFGCRNERPLRPEASIFAQFAGVDSTWKEK